MRNLKRVIPIAALCLVFGCMSMRGWFYTGDGKYQACSDALGPGYSVTFPAFPTDRPYVASYTLGSLPAIRTNPLVYLCFRAGRVPKAGKARVTATIHVTQKDSSGQNVSAVDLMLGNAHWAEGDGLYSAYGGQSRLHIEPLFRYVLQVSYDPGPIPPPAKEAFFRIDACASY